MEKLDHYTNILIEKAVEYSPKLLLALLTLIVGLILIKWTTNSLKALFRQKDFDPALETFLASLTGIILKVLLGLSVVSILGVTVTSFIAILGAAGLAVGMALSGTLQNFAGGVMILIFKPFTVGDFIEAKGHSGIVSEIQIFNTLLKTPDNKLIIIPNSAISSDSLVNFTAEETRRVDLTFGISYEDDVDKAIGIINEVIASNETVLKDPEPFVAMSELADSSINIVTRMWANTSDYWDVYFGTLDKVKKAFDAQGISIPYPQTDVHLYKVEK